MPYLSSCLGSCKAHVLLTTVMTVHNSILIVAFAMMTGTVLESGHILWSDP